MGRRYLCDFCGEGDRSEFYEGCKNKCKQCKKDYQKKYSLDNSEKVRAYERFRSMLPHKVKARDDYAKTDRGKERLAAGNRAYRERNPLKYRAHLEVTAAIKRGTIIKGRCEECGDTPAEAHHDDYRKPLEFRWLCKKHHLLLHGKIKRSRMVNELYD